MNKSYSLEDIIGLLMNHMKLIIVVTVLFAAGGFGISKYMLPKEYSSHITMFVLSSSSVATHTADYNSITNSKLLVATYMEVLKADSVMAAVGEQLQDHFDQGTLAKCFSFNENNEILPESIKRCIAISTVEDTSSITVTSTARNAEVAADICNSLTQVAQKYVTEAIGVGSVNTIDTAKVYNTPVSPKNVTNAMTGGAAGFMLIAGVLFVFDLLNNTVRNPKALKKTYRRVIIGEIPQLNAKGKKRFAEGDKPYRLTDFGLSRAVTDSYRSIRTNVSLALCKNERKLIVVSSANSGEGASEAAANIAIALAQSGSKVLLIDTDIRNPIQHEIFGLKNQTGLSSAFNNVVPLNQCIQQNVMDSLDVLTAGPVIHNPSELLASEQMTALLDFLNNHYNAIIIDTPPVNTNSDAMVLAKSVAGLVLVVRYGITTNQELSDACEKIGLANMELLGFILNGTKEPKRTAYYSRNVN